MLAPIEHRIAIELNVRPAQVNAAIALLDEGATVPFIARYRKEVTGGLDDTQLRTLKSASATCANWKSAAPPSWPASRNRAS
jgi:transcriptional accessory protein Tex/SPT6